MAFSVSPNRSRSQDSPMFWLSLVAGSLALHLALLLIGRWYFSQTASAPSGGTQAPLDFVEIDPNAPALKRPIAPSSTATQAVPKAAPPSTAAAESNQSPSSIEKLNPQVERPQPQIAPSPSPSPFTPQPDRSRGTVQRSQSGQSPTKPNRSTTSSSRNNPNQTSPTGSSSSGSTSSGGSSNSSSSTSGASGDSTPKTPTGATSGEQQPNGASTTGGGSSGTELSGDLSFQGKIAQTLERDPNERQRDGALSITVKNETIPQLKIEFPAKLPAQVLDLKVLIVMDREGRVVQTEVRDDSPSFQTNPELKDSKIRENVQAVVNNLLSSTNDLFEVKPEANATSDQLFSRIAQIQLRVSQ